MKEGPLEDKHCHEGELFTALVDHLGLFTALRDHSWQHSLRVPSIAGFFFPAYSPGRQLMAVCFAIHGPGRSV